VSEIALLETPPPDGASTDRLADLILVRLLPSAKSRPSPKKLRNDVGELLRRPLLPERFADTLADLRAAGLVTPRGQHLTDAGRARALEYLGAGGAELPAKCDWRAIKCRYLVPKALGLSPTSAEDAKIFGNKDRLAAWLLKREFRLPIGTPATLRGVFQAMACQYLGYPDQVELDDLIPVILGRQLGDDRTRTLEELGESAPPALLGAPKAGRDGQRAEALAGVFEPEDAAEPFDLEAFANTVRAAARTCPTGRFGDNKVFISHVWRQLFDQPQIAPLGLDRFKTKLLDANRAGRLTLSRADLVQVMDPADVRESETAYRNAVFHFILIERE
jgi:hypothetical protein